MNVLIVKIYVYIYTIYNHIFIVKTISTSRVISYVEDLVHIYTLYMFQRKNIRLRSNYVKILSENVCLGCHPVGEIMSNLMNKIKYYIRIEKQLLITYLIDRQLFEGTFHSK